MATKPSGVTDLHPERSERAEAQRRMATSRRFCFAMERRWFGVPTRPAAWGGLAPPENRRRQPLPIRPGWRPIALSKAQGAVLFRGLTHPCGYGSHVSRFSPLRLWGQAHEAHDVFRGELHPNTRPERMDTEPLEILVKVPEG